MLDKEFNSSNVTPKFELSNDPEHVLDIDALHHRYHTMFNCRGLLSSCNLSRPLRRIRALRDFGDVKKGDIGGYLQNADYLDHDGDCWIYDDACVLARWEISPTDGHPLASKPTFLTGNAKLHDQAIFLNGIIDGNTLVHGTVLCDDVHFTGNTVVRQRRLPFKITGEIHNNRPDPIAHQSFYNAELQEFRDSCENNPNPLVAFWEILKLNWREPKLPKPNIRR